MAADDVTRVTINKPDPHNDYHDYLEKQHIKWRQRYKWETVGGYIGGLLGIGALGLCDFLSLYYVQKAPNNSHGDVVAYNMALSRSIINTIVWCLCGLTCIVILIYHIIGMLTDSEWPDHSSPCRCRFCPDIQITLISIYLIQYTVTFIMGLIKAEYYWIISEETRAYVITSLIVEPVIIYIGGCFSIVGIFLDSALRY